MAKFNVKIRITKVFEPLWVEVEAASEDEAWDKADDYSWSEEQLTVEQYLSETLEVEEAK